MEKIKAKIQGILLNYSQKSVIGWAVEESYFEDVANEIVKKLTLTDVVSSKRKNTLELFMQLMEEFKEACSEEDNGIYDPLEEFEK